MKKFLATAFAFFMLCSTTLLYTGCSEPFVNDVFEQVVDPIKLTDTFYCKNTSIKTTLVTYTIMPTNFDFDELDKRGYVINITATYSVYYKKDWNGILYLGAPKYETYLVPDLLTGVMEYGLKAPSSSTERSISLVEYPCNLKGKKIVLTFSTDNIQNIIYFKDIVITINCYK